VANDHSRACSRSDLPGNLRALAALDKWQQHLCQCNWTNDIDLELSPERCWPEPADVVTCGVLAAEAIRETQAAVSGVCRFLERRRPDERAFGHILVQRQSSGGGRQQLPVLRHNHDIDAVNDAVCRDQIGMFDPGPIDLQVGR